MQETTNPAKSEAYQTMMSHIVGMAISKSIEVSARLALADMLEEGPRTLEDLAGAADAHPDALYRLLRFLCGLGIFEETEDGRFAQTELSDLLRSNRESSLRDFALMWNSHYKWNAWGHLEYSVHNDKPAFPYLNHGLSLWDYFVVEDHESGQIFSRSMSSLASMSNQAIVDAYDFSEARHLVDIGGAHGSLLASILRANPHLDGTLFDLPPVIEDAKHHIPTDLEGRYKLVPGNFHKQIPTGGDLYFMRYIIHDWDDAECVNILKNCRMVMEPDSRLLVFEGILEPGNKFQFTRLLDITMLALLGSRERSEEGFRQLFEASGFRLNRIIPTESELKIIEALPA